MALNVAIDFRRRERRRPAQIASLDDGIVAADPATGDAAKLDELHELRELLDQQADADRAILLLYLEGNSYREIGDVFGISESNVGTRLNRLKNSLRQTALASRDNDQEGE